LLGGWPVWRNENRGRYDRSRLRYPSDLTDEEWGLMEPLIPPSKRGDNRRTVNVREVVNDLMYVLSTGCQWRKRMVRPTRARRPRAGGNMVRAHKLDRM
jgi:transposase